MNDSEAKNSILSLSSDELKRLTDFFAVLVQVDKRLNITGHYGKPNNGNPSNAD